MFRFEKYRTDFCKRCYKSCMHTSAEKQRERFLLILVIVGTIEEIVLSCKLYEFSENFKKWRINFKKIGREDRQMSILLSICELSSKNYNKRHTHSSLLLFHITEIEIPAGHNKNPAFNVFHTWQKRHRTRFQQTHKYITRTQWHLFISRTPLSADTWGEQGRPADSNVPK